jgi:parvulin-like peptidyl-prolyl isomerase
MGLFSRSDCLKQVVGILLAGAAALSSGCGGNGTPSADPRTTNLSPANIQPAPPKAPTLDPAPVTRPVAAMDAVIVTVNKEPLTMRQLVAPLIEAHGLTMMLNLVRLELVRQDAANVGVTISPADFAEERQATLDKMFADARPEQKLKDELEKAIAKKDDAEAKRLREEIASQREQFLDQFLQDRHISRVEFDIVLRMNAYLRRIAEPQIKGKISEQDLRSAFGQLYGETARVRYIELQNLNEVGQAQRRLAAGDKFEDVARDMSHNRASAALGGEMPPFSRSAQDLPKPFVDVAFSLKPGQVSDPVNVNNAYLLVKLEEKIPPKAVKYEDQRESVQRILYDRLLAASVRQLREALDKQAVQSMQISDPVLKQQYQAMVDRQIHDRQKMSQQLEQDRLIGNAPATHPSGPPPADVVPVTKIPLPVLPTATQPATRPQ